MKIAIIAGSLPDLHVLTSNRKVGGVDFAIHRIANALAESSSENEVTVFSPTLCPPDAKYNHIHIFSYLASCKSKRIARLVLFPLLLNFMNFKDFDVVHLHGDDWFFFNRSIATVRTMHGSALKEAKSSTSLKRKVSQYFIYRLEHISKYLATLTLAIGKDTKDIYNTEFTIDNGVNLNIFYPGEKTEFPSILFVGTWQGRKRGGFIFQRFVQDILPVFPSAQLYMVSDFCPQHPNVQDVRSPSDQELSDLFREAWIFAYPSIYEGFGIPYLEALASGLAIVSSPNEGAEYVLNNGEYGIITTDDSFSQEVIELLKEPQKRHLLEKKGLGRAALFSWDNISKAHEFFYAQAISKFKERNKYS